MLLEELSTGHAVFVTLTYRPEDLPVAEDVGPVRPEERGRGILVQKDVQLFMKRLRKRLGPRKVRYVAVGEYGDRFWRPHYHLVLYGLNVLDEGVIEAAWSKGFIEVAEFNHERAMYMAGYCTKKLTAAALRGRKAGPWVDRQLRGRPPEFMLYSRNLGIGAQVALEATLTTRTGARGLAATGDIPAGFRQYGRIWPLDRRMRDRLRRTLGIPEKAVERALAGIPSGCDFTPERIEKARQAETRLHQRARSRSKPLDSGPIVFPRAESSAPPCARSATDALARRLTRAARSRPVPALPASEAIH